MRVGRGAVFWRGWFSALLWYSCRGSALLQTVCLALGTVVGLVPCTAERFLCIALLGTIGSVPYWG